ncbi:hypothetical protein FLP41_15055 [Paracoccus marcusii]|uniref:hypothetical protein n=1 Tax=Paracoccus marcusii TaxID=59779 RepID=UPI002ED15A38|nr:hypothetical protein FLP41_15055 [Paracoccus marcusii]
MILSNGNQIKGFTKAEVEESADSTAMPLTMALYDNLAPPAPPSMIKPIAAYVVNSFSVQYSQQITDSIRSHEKIIIDDSMWRPPSVDAPGLDGWKYLSMTAPMRLPVSVRLGAILLEPVKGLLGEQNSGDVRYDGMNEEGRPSRPPLRGGLRRSSRSRLLPRRSRHDSICVASDILKSR